jgi:hypothetical protein
MAEEIPRAEDKQGHALQIGDTVELVYGGDRHEGRIEEIADAWGRPYVTVAVTAAVPASSVLRLKGAAKKAPKGKGGTGDDPRQIALPLEEAP